MLHAFKTRPQVLGFIRDRVSLTLLEKFGAKSENISLEVKIIVNITHSSVEGFARKESLFISKSTGKDFS
jgi:hypothetical protein